MDILNCTRGFFVLFFFVFSVWSVFISCHLTQKWNLEICVTDTRILFESYCVNFPAFPGGWVSDIFDWPDTTDWTLCKIKLFSFIYYYEYYNNNKVPEPPRRHLRRTSHTAARVTVRQYAVARQPASSTHPPWTGEYVFAVTQSGEHANTPRCSLFIHLALRWVVAGMLF